MIAEVTIYDHLTHLTLVSRWIVTAKEGVTGAANAAFVAAFGSSPGQPDFAIDDGEIAILHLRGMKVTVQHDECRRSAA